MLVFKFVALAVWSLLALLVALRASRGHRFSVLVGLASAITVTVFRAPAWAWTVGWGVFAAALVAAWLQRTNEAK